MSGLHIRGAATQRAVPGGRTNLCPAPRFSTFRRLEGAELKGGIGLLQVERDQLDQLGDRGAGAWVYIRWSAAPCRRSAPDPDAGGVVGPTAASTRVFAGRCRHVHLGGSFRADRVHVFADPDVRPERPSLEEKRQRPDRIARVPETFSSRRSGPYDFVGFALPGGLPETRPAHLGGGFPKARSARARHGHRACGASRRVRCRARGAPLLEEASSSSPTHSSAQIRRRFQRRSRPPAHR